jgi:hypothetical protein
LKALVQCVVFLATAIAAQGQLKFGEIPLPQDRTSMFSAIDVTSPDGLAALRGEGIFSWTLAPVVFQSWDGFEKHLVLAAEIIGSDNAPKSISILLDGKTVALGSSDWTKDSRQNLAAVYPREDLVRAIASASKVQISFLGDTTVSADFDAPALELFRRVISAADGGPIVGVSLSEERLIMGITKNSNPSDIQKQQRISMKGPPVTPVPLIPPKPEKPTKVDRHTYLLSKVPEAAQICHDGIISGSKDPYSVEFLGDYTYSFGRTLWRNWIWVSWETMGRNTYGAVLRHGMTCGVSCPPDEQCSLVSMDDDPR